MTITIAGDVNRRITLAGTVNRRITLAGTVNRRITLMGVLSGFALVVYGDNGLDFSQAANSMYLGAL